MTGMNDRLQSNMVGALFSLVLFSAWGCASLGGAEEDMSSGCREVLARQEAAWNEGDMDGFLAGYAHSDELRYVSKKMNRGFDGLSKAFRSGYPDRDTMGKLRFDDLEIEVLSEDRALVTGAYHLKRASGPATGRFTLIMRRYSRGMVIVYDHTSEINVDE